MTYQPITPETTPPDIRLAQLERVWRGHERTNTKMPPKYFEEMQDLREQFANPPSPEEVAKAQVLAQAELEAHRLIAKEQLDNAIENTEGDNNDPATILTAIESLRA